MMTDRPFQEIQQLLRRLGVTENYTGFPHAAYAVHLSIGQPDRLHLITKQLYPDVAKHYGTTWRAVERNIRTVVSVAWASNPLLLSELAGRELTSKPNNASFLSILASSFSSGTT